MNNKTLILRRFFINFIRGDNDYFNHFANDFRDIDMCSFKHYSSFVQLDDASVLLFILLWQL